MQDADAPPATGRGPRITLIFNALGAAASLALVVGIGVWSYKTLMRDVSGVPVVRAAEGLARITPADPGGQLADHMGLSVNAVAAEGTARAPADRLVLAPAPIELSVEDRAPAPEQAAPAPAPADAPDGDTTLKILAEDLSAAFAPLAPEAAQQQDASETSPQATGGTQRGLGRSLRPQQRPLALAEVQAVAAVIPDPAEVVEVDPDAIPVGARLAQLGAFDSAATARREWERLDTRFAEYLDGKSRVIQQASSGGRSFYRLRAMGFADLGDARRFCAMLVAENAECIPVITR